jgi:hypothetical protein
MSAASPELEPAVDLLDSDLEENRRVILPEVNL